MLHECRVTHVLWAIWDVEFDGVFIFFKLGPRKCLCQIKLGQIRSDFKTQKFSYNVMPILSSFASGSQKCYLFSRASIKSARDCISN